jgi:hypothetical protein
MRYTKVKITKNCLICGKEFIGNNRKKYCSIECRYKHTLEYGLVYKENHKKTD